MCVCEVWLSGSERGWPRGRTRTRASPSVCDPAPNWQRFSEPHTLQMCPVPFPSMPLSAAAPLSEWETERNGARKKETKRLRRKRIRSHGRRAGLCVFVFVIKAKVWLSLAVWESRFVICSFFIRRLSVRPVAYTVRPKMKILSLFTLVSFKTHMLSFCLWNTKRKMLTVLTKLWGTIPRNIWTSRDFGGCKNSF